MKKHFFVVVMIGMMFSTLVSCGKEDELDHDDLPGKQDEFVDSKLNFMGEMKVVNQDGSIYINSSSECSCEKESMLKIVLLNAKLAERMPSLDSICVADIPYTSQGDDCSFAAESIVPTFKGNPFAQYTIKDLKGTIKGDSLLFSAQMGVFPIEYKGLRK